MIGLTFLTTLFMGDAEVLAIKLGSHQRRERRKRNRKRNRNRKNLKLRCSGNQNDVSR